MVIEVPRGGIVETLVRRCVPVLATDREQLDSFPDRFSPGGAKDDSRDAYLWARAAVQ